MSPRHQFRLYYPEEARKIDEGYAELGIVVVDTVTRFFRYVFPFFVPRSDNNNKTDSDTEKGI
jgi:hypothetical protein